MWIQIASLAALLAVADCAETLETLDSDGLADDEPLRVARLDVEGDKDDDGDEDDQWGRDADNLLADPHFRVIEDGEFVHWYSPIVFRSTGTPDRGSCMLDDPLDICSQSSYEWLLEPKWGDIDEASFRFKCGGDACRARIDVAIDRTVDDQCEGPEALVMRDSEGNPLEYGVDWFVANVDINDVCVYLQFFDVDHGWARKLFTLDLPDRRTYSFAATRSGPGDPMWVDDAVLSLLRDD